jgi:ribosomal protein L17
METTKTTSEQQKCELLMKKLEKEGMEKAKDLNMTIDKIINITKMEETEKAKVLKTTTDMLTNIMQNGADEFEKQMGRKMTYGEMREMYG